MSMEPTQSQLLENLPFENQDADLFSFLDNLGQNISVAPGTDAGYRGQATQAARAAKADAMSELPSWDLPAMEGGLGVPSRAEISGSNGFASTSGYSQPVAMPAHNGAQQQQQTLSAFPGSEDSAQVIDLSSECTCCRPGAHSRAGCSHALSVASQNPGCD